LGLFGSSVGDIKKVHLTGVSIDVSSSYSYAGGLVGYNSGGMITDCTASGKVIKAYSKEGTAYRGGFIGYFNDGALTGNKNETELTPAIGWDERLTPPGPSDDI
jgi:hypothetical protein